MLHDLLTVIITTSAVKSNPSTDVIEQVIESFALVPGLDKCRKIFICDGLKVSQGKHAAWKSGKAPLDAHERYEQYIANLRRLCENGDGQFSHSEVVPLPTRHGFAFGAYEGVKKATTPFVLVVQHDRAFVNRICDLVSLIKDMDHHHRQWVEYVAQGLQENGIATLKWRSELSPDDLLAQPNIFTLDDLMAGKACPYPIPYPKVDSPERLELRKLYSSATASSSSSSSSSLNAVLPCDVVVPEKFRSIYRPAQTRSSILPAVLFKTKIVSKYNTDLNSLDLTQFDSNTSGYLENTEWESFRTSESASILSPTSSVQLDVCGNPILPTLPRHHTYPTPLPVHYVAMISNHTQEYAAKCVTHQVPVYRGALPCYHAGDALLGSLSAAYNDATSTHDTTATTKRFSTAEGDATNHPDTAAGIAEAEAPPTAAADTAVSERFLFSPRLLPMTYWYDSTHIARTEFYKELYNTKDRGRFEFIREGDFTEDRLIQVATTLLKYGGQRQRDYNTFHKVHDERLLNAHPLKAHPLEDKSTGEEQSPAEPRESADSNSVLNPYHHDVTQYPWFDYQAPMVTEYRAHRICDDDLLTWTQTERWNPFVHGSSPLLKDLHHVALRIAACADVQSPSEAHNVLMREWGLWLYENLQGTAYDLNIAYEPKWLHDHQCLESNSSNSNQLCHKTKQQDGLRNANISDPSFSCSHDLCCLDLDLPPPSPSPSPTLLSHLPLERRACERDSDDVSQARDVERQQIQSSEHTNLYQWCIATGTRQGMNVQHLDGKAFMTPIQRLHAYRKLMSPPQFHQFLQKSPFYTQAEIATMLSELDMDGSTVEHSTQTGKTPSPQDPFPSSSSSSSLSSRCSQCSSSSEDSPSSDSD